MVDSHVPPKSPTLEPPRKSVELEDPGAHSLDVSEDGDDVFDDALEGRVYHSRPSSPIPITRVEKVDDRESHGEVPGTAAYKMRTQDAVPDELEIIPDGNESRRRPESPADRSANPGGSPIPKTVVEKVGPAPGTAAHSNHRADAVPDVVLQGSPLLETASSENSGEKISPEASIPSTMITKVDSEPSHGEVPGTDAFDMRKSDAKPDVVEKQGDVPSLPTISRSQLSKPKRMKQPVDGTSPIAADGGFGPMDPEDSQDEGISDKHVDDGVHANADDGFGEGFDDFEVGTEDEDFGDFDDGVEESSAPGGEYARAEPSAQPTHSLLSSATPFPLLDFSELDTLDDIITATNPYLDAMFPTTKETYPPAPPPPSDQNSMFLTDRSLSLWSQLVAPPPLQPPNWVRSRIRRLFLVSLGVPVDLDEILPASKQKKLILPSTHLRSGSQSPPDGRRTGSRVRLKQDNVSTSSVDRPSSTKPSRKRKGPPAAPELDIQRTKMLCATTEAALSNMTDGELQAHVKKLEELTARASEVLEYWLKRRDSALGDKEVFEGVIENLVKHARRVRK